MSTIARFVILTYDRTSTCNDINTARRKLFAKKGRPLESIPPTLHALVQHDRRAVYQGSLCWGQVLQAQSQLPCPSECRVGNFYPHVVLTMVKTLVKTGLGKTTKTHMSWVKLGKTNFLNSKNASCFHILFTNL